MIWRPASICCHRQAENPNEIISPWLRRLLIFLFFSVLGNLSAFALQRPGLATPTENPESSSDRIETDIPTLTRQALKSVVLVVASDEAGNVLTQGSGFMVSRDGKVVTNHHVIEGATSAIIKFPNGAFHLIEGSLALDPARDLAVLKASGTDFAFLPLGNLDEAEIGQDVVAIGSPLALEATVSNGIISAIREWEADFTVIQTTAPISPGSSGGVLLNMKGEVIGVTSHQLSQGQNLNFAVSADYIRPLLGSTRVEPLLGRGITESDALESSRQSEQSDSNPLRLPREWIYRNDASTIITIRMDGDFIYERSSIRGSRYSDRGIWRRTCETRKFGNEWIGECTHVVEFFEGIDTKVGSCTLKTLRRIKSVTPTRIEGETQVFSDTPDANGCPSVLNAYRLFVLIPRF